MSYKHYNKVSDFKDLSVFFFEYVGRLELENKHLKEQIEFLRTNKKGKNPRFTDLDLSVRTYNCIVRFFYGKKEPADILLSDIYNIEIIQLKMMWGFGKKSLTELEVIFHEYGLPDK